MCWGSSASLIVDLTFHGQSPTSQVRCWTPRNGPFACLAGTDATSKLQWQGAKSVIWPILAKNSTPGNGHAFVLDTICVVKNSEAVKL